MRDAEPLERRTLFLLKKVNKAIRDYHLIESGDRIAVAVSGGKDSLVLLRLLLAYRTTQRRHIDLAVIHVVVEDAAGSVERAAALESYCKELDVDFFARPLPMNDDESWPLSCQRCAWNRRKTLFVTADRLGCNKVAMGHHADDVAQTTLLNLIYQGRLDWIDPKRDFFDGEITVIRPMFLVPEKEIISFARRAGYPIGDVLCPGAMNSERVYAAELLRQIEQRVPWVKTTLRRAVEGSLDRRTGRE